jgi:phage virion morphogenesis protein
MASFTIDCNDGPFLEALTRLAKRGDDLNPAFHEIGAELKRTTRLRFDSQTDPKGKRWDALSETYATWKSTKPKTEDPRGPVIDKILHFALDLRDSIDYRVTDDALTIGSNVIYARAHQLGYAEGGLKARAFLGIDEGDRNFIADVLGDYLALPPN